VVSSLGPQLRVVSEAAFADERFWAAANRLAAAGGHADHRLYLVGEVERTDRYRLLCVDCDQTLASFIIERAGGGEASSESGREDP
jgi:hypothetical protein